MPPFYEIRSSEMSVIRNGKPLSFPAHLHSSIEILYVFSGAQSLEIDGIAYSINAGEAAVIFPDIIHSYHRTGSANTEALILIFHPRLLGALIPSLGNVRPLVPRLPQASIHPDALYAFEHIRREDDITLKLGWLHVIMSHLLQQMELQPRQQPPVQELPRKIIEFVAEHFTEPLTLEALAAEFCISKYYISRIFSNHIKMNFRNYLALLRAEYASKLILTTNASLTSICGNAGFDSQRTFNRAFLAIYGMPPRKFRAQWIKHRH